MTAANMPITSFWHQTVSASDDLILGVLTIFLIATISEIVTSILLRTRTASTAAPAVRAAYAIDQFSRFRPIHFAPREPTFRFRYLFAFFVTAAIVAIDVVFVLLTQQRIAHSTQNQYNIVAFQPVGTTRGRSKFIRRLAGDRQCMTPLMLDAKQRRNYAISACIRTASKEPSERYARETDHVAIRSWYHRGGSDHNITFGDGWHSVSVRAYLYVESDDEGGKHVLFNTSADMADAFYVQEVVMYGAMEWACNERENGPDALQSCEEVVRSLEIKRRDTVGKDIVLWRGKKKDVVERVTGTVTRFEVSLKDPFRAINSGLRALFTSGAMYEVEGSGSYARISDDKRENGIGKLISEEGRVAGVWLMCGLLGLLAVMMVTLRVVLRPTTLGEVAMRSTTSDERMAEALEMWEQEEREMVRKRTATKEIEREKVEDEVSFCSSVDANFALKCDDQ